MATMAMTALNSHEVYNRSASDADNMLKDIILDALKSGGILTRLDPEGTKSTAIA